MAAGTDGARHLTENFLGVFEMMERVAADGGVGLLRHQGRFVRVRHDVAGIRFQTPLAQTLAPSPGHRGGEIQPHDGPARHQKGFCGSARAHPEIDQPGTFAEADPLGHRAQARLFRVAVIAAVGLGHPREGLDVSLLRRIHPKAPLWEFA